MKRFLILVLALALCLPMFAGCAGGAASQTSSSPSAPSQINTDHSPDTPAGSSAEDSSPTEESSGTPSPSSSSNTEPEDMEVRYGVYYLKSFENDVLGINGRTNAFGVNFEEESYNRLTVHFKTVNGESYATLYQGDDEQKSVSLVSYSGTPKLYLGNDKYANSDASLWIPQYVGDGYVRLISKKNPEYCISLDEKKTLVSTIEEGNKSQYITFEKAAAHPDYREFISDKGNFVVRIPEKFVSRKVVTQQQMIDYANFMQEAMDAEIELTGYQPYDIIVIKAWQSQNIVAGVINNYNHITVDKGFMESEMSKLSYRDKNLNLKDLSFGMLHEMGHMFDSNRAWNFESEAWTDLKLCYVLYKMTLDHKDTDGYVFACSSSDYAAQDCFTYETMANGYERHNGKGGLNIHADKGAMETVYGFFGAARLFLLMAYDFGWEPFIKTFHWYQDNGYTQDSFVRWERFTTFVEKLSEYSGKDIKKDYLSDNNWKIFEDYYKERTTDVV